jgi:uncharacterized protein YwqG
MGLFNFLFGKKNNNGEKALQEPVKQHPLLQKIEVQPGLFVATAFARHWDIIAKTKLPSITIKASPAENIALQKSKFGHYPLMPAGFNYPVDEQGKFMFPLAQINFKEIPLFAGYPTSGYLLFFISAFDDVYGLDFDNNQSQKNFRVLFFEEEDVVDHKTDFSFLDEVMKSDMPPVYKPHSLTFETKEEFIGLGDVRYEESPDFNIDLITDQYPDLTDKLVDEVYNEFSVNGHKIGGYAYFTQHDPRLNNSQTSDYLLLLQIDSDDEIMWGDVGVANFFIHPEALAKKDFSNVLYNWDCC